MLIPDAPRYGVSTRNLCGPDLPLLGAPRPALRSILRIPHADVTPWVRGKPLHWRVGSVKCHGSRRELGFRALAARTRIAEVMAYARTLEEEIAEMRGRLDQPPQLRGWSCRASTRSAATFR
jgi:hypothetical protein